MSDLVTIDMKEGFSKAFRALSNEDQQVFFDHATPELILVIDKLIPGLPFISVLKQQILAGTYSPPTPQSYRAWMDKFLNGELRVKL